METKGKGNDKGAMTWQEAVLSWIGGAAGVLGLVLLFCEPADDGSPLTWQFAATKIGGFAVLLGVAWLYKWMKRHYGGQNYDDRA